MHGPEEVPLAATDMPMAEALVAMTAKRFGCLGTEDGEGRLIGVIVGDLRRALRSGAGLLDRMTGEVMTTMPRAIGPEMLAAEALQIMNEGSITALFVVDGAGRPVGMLHIHDLLRTGVA